MTWWYNTESGALTSAGSAQTFFQQLQGGIGLGAGWHQLPIPSNDSEAQAAAEARKLYPTGTAPTTSVKTQVSNEASQQLTGSATGLSGLASIGDFFGRLTEGATWIRALELLLGLGLVIIGVAHAAGGTPAGRAARKIAGKAALA
jgi:hypothetical protein